MTKIEWTHMPGYKGETWNPATGCTPISAGCAHCYAKRIIGRGMHGYDFKPRVHPKRLDIPLHWKKPRFIFVCSMGDLFHEDIAFEDIDAILAAVQGAPRHLFVVLTKRAERMAQYFTEAGVTRNDDIPNLWLGVTAENQKAADERIPILLQIPAALRFVSVEPMLGSVALQGSEAGQVLGPCDQCGHTDSNPDCIACDGIPSLDWVICGGESGPGARPMHPDWARKLRDECIDANVPFFFKQWGAWKPVAEPGYTGNQAPNYHRFNDGQWMFKAGKKNAGNLLDGQVYAQFPEVK